MKYMFDTNTCIHMVKHNQIVLNNYANNRNEGIAISTITLAELEFGVCNNATYYDKNRAKIVSFLTLVDILPFDGAAAIEYGVIYADLTQKRAQIGKMDALVAAHAKSLNLIVVTNNIREFQRVKGIIVEDWTI